MVDLLGELLVKNSILPVKATTTTSGSSVDRLGFYNLLLIAQIGQSGDTLSGSVYLTVVFEESANGTTWTTIDNADLGGGENSVVINSNDADEVVIVREYLGNKRYVRVKVAFTGTHTNGTPIAGLVVLAEPRHAPQS